MEWLLIGALVGAGAYAGRRWRSHREDRAIQREQLDGVRRLADEDVTVFGEQLQRLGIEVDGLGLDEETRLDYQTALDSYEFAQRAVPRIDSVDEISKITDALDTGRYALACVQARIAGRQPPVRRVPCFFNAQHGPSVKDVQWTAPGRGTRMVPACEQDAARVARHQEPEVRRVKIRGQQVPFWEAGDVYGSYSPVGKAYLTGLANQHHANHIGLGGG